MNPNDIQIGPYQNAKGDIINLHIKDGLISKIEKNPQPVNQKASNGIIFPGLVDMHVHFRQPGHEHKETIKSGVSSALSGGVTTCGDMPNNDPVTDNYQAIQRKVGIDGSKSENSRVICHCLSSWKLQNLAEVRKSIVFILSIYFNCKAFCCYAISMPICLPLRYN